MLWEKRPPLAIFKYPLLGTLGSPLCIPVRCFTRCLKGYHLKTFFCRVYFWGVAWILVRSKYLSIPSAQALGSGYIPLWVRHWMCKVQEAAPTYFPKGLENKLEQKCHPFQNLPKRFSIHTHHAQIDLNRSHKKPRGKRCQTITPRSSRRPDTAPFIRKQSFLFEIEPRREPKANTGNVYELTVLHCLFLFVGSAGMKIQ